MQISNSLEWSTAKTHLLKQVQSVSFNPELRKMLNNIDIMVKELSRREVVERRHRSTAQSLELMAVNQAIETLEQWIVMAALIG